MWNKLYENGGNEIKWRMILAFMNVIYAIAKEAQKKIQDFKGIRTRDLPIPVRCSNQLSHEAPDVGSWSSMYSYIPVKKMNVIDVYEINHIRTAEMKSSEEWSTQLWTQFM